MLKVPPFYKSAIDVYSRLNTIEYFGCCNLSKGTNGFEKRINLGCLHLAIEYAPTVWYLTHYQTTQDEAWPTLIRLSNDY
jgi:hypothetical protein